MRDDDAAAKWWRYAEIVVDLAYLTDIIISCFADEYSAPGQVMTNRMIFARYAQGYLVPDLLGCLPGLLAGERHTGRDYPYLLKLFRYGHFGRLYDGIELSLRAILQAVRKHTVKNITMFLTLNFTFLLIWHVFACLWVVIGRRDDTEGNVGWVNKELLTYEGGADNSAMPKDLQNTALWASAFYFVVTTSTTVGYGDYGASTMAERIYCLGLQFVGICIFSTMQDQTAKYEYVTTLQTIVHEKVADIKGYLQQVDRSRAGKPLDGDIYEHTVAYIEHSYRVGVV